MIDLGLTLAEAKIEMQKGNKVRHTYFADHEFIYMKGNKVISEDGVNHGFFDDFMRLRPGESFLIGWEIFKPNKI